MSLKDSALHLYDSGYTVIPASSSTKKPLIKWAEYIGSRPDRRTTEKWFDDFPKAGIAIVTGILSGVAVIDIDEDAAPDSFPLTPTSKTRRGYHLYFKYPEDKDIRNKTKCVFPYGKGDIRGEGGYVLVPPTEGYEWINNPFSTPLLPFPEDESPSFKQEPFNKNSSVKTLVKGVSEGSRNDSLARIIGSLVRDGLGQEDCLQFALAWNALNNPPLPSAEVERTVQSILESDLKNTIIPLSEAVRDWLQTSDGVFTIRELASDLGVTDRLGKQNLSNILLRLCSERTIERYGDRRGQFRIVDQDVEVIDFSTVAENPLDIVFPFELERFYYPLPKNIIVVAGSPDAGKTAFLLNFVKLNMGKWPVRYCSSEMGKHELKDRLLKFGLPLSDWTFEAINRSSNFADVILPDAINIIDFLEISDNFYTIGGTIKSIWEKLNNGIVVIAIQKSPGKDLGRGADMGLEKPRLYLSMEKGKIIIIKAKNWANPQINPTGHELHYKLVQGCQFIIVEDWFKSTGSFKHND